jgi:hypothetical protein
MPTPIIITVDEVRLEGILFDTDSGKRIASNLPIETSFNTWGEEFYFQIPVNLPLDETATTKVKIGDIGYWPDGSALALFFGPTPMSSGPEPVPASNVNIVGEIKGDATLLKRVMGGADKIKIAAV